MTSPPHPIPLHRRTRGAGVPPHGDDVTAPYPPNAAPPPCGLPPTRPVGAAAPERAEPPNASAAAPPLPAEPPPPPPARPLLPDPSGAPPRLRAGGGGGGEKEAAHTRSASGSRMWARGDDVNAAARSDGDAAWCRHRACADVTVAQYGKPGGVAVRRDLMTSESGAEKWRRCACAELTVRSTYGAER